MGVMTKDMKNNGAPARKPVTKRGPGRPSASQGNNVSRETILNTAFELARTVPLQDLSIVLVAKELGITPALIHYYIGGRDWLTSGIMNLFYREMVENWPQPTARWEVDIFELATVIYNRYVKYSGVAAYAVSHNHFRVFQLLQEGEHDYGVEFLELYTGRMMEAGLCAERTAIYGHMLLEFIISNAHSLIKHRHPHEYVNFIQERVEELDPKHYPAIHFTRLTLSDFDGAAAFSEGCRLILLGMQSEQLRTALDGGVQRPPQTTAEEAQALRRASQPSSAKRN